MRSGEPLTVIVTGGARSGKSDYAVGLAEKYSPRVLVAPATPVDKEMARRIERHRRKRGPEWRTVEEPYEVEEAVRQQLSAAGVIVIDCVTIWISNLLISGEDEERILERVDKLAEIISRKPANLIVVTNEVGSGIVPSNEISRKFRDLAGLANRKLAGACELAVLMAMGIPLVIKGGEG